MSSFVGGGARYLSCRNLLLALSMLVGILALSACTVPQPAVPQANLEATVEAMVDARLTEVAGRSGEGAQTDGGTPESQVADETSTSDGVPSLITPTPDRSGVISDYLVSNTRHFKGDPDAPVTIIEFSDFQ